MGAETLNLKSFITKHKLISYPYFLSGTSILLGETIEYKNIKITVSLEEESNLLTFVRLESVENHSKKSLLGAFSSAITFAEWLMMEIPTIKTFQTFIAADLPSKAGEKPTITNEEHADLYKKHFGAVSLGYDYLKGGELLSLDVVAYRSKKQKK